MKASQQKQQIEVEREEQIDAEITATIYEVTTAVAGPRTVYQATFDIDFELPSPESTVVIDPAAARLAGVFESLATPVPAAAIQDSSPPIVTLDSARAVTQIDLNGYAGATVQLFRVDQTKVAPQPTVTAAANSNGTASFSGFTDVRFAVAVDGDSLRKSEIGFIHVTGAPTGGRLGLADPGSSAPPAFFWTAPNGTGTSADAGQAFAQALQAYLATKAGDTSPSARVVIQCDQPCEFAMTHFETGASFALDGFAFPALDASALTDPDTLAGKIAAAADPVSAYLRSALGSQTLLDGLNEIVAGNALYDAGRFAGVALSDATKASLAAGESPRLNRLLLQDAYPDLVAAPAAKRVLRFPADRAGQAGAAVSPPAGATFTKATLATQESLGSDRAGDPAAATAAGGSAGVHVSGNDTAAVSVDVAQALTATGLALPLIGLATGTQVALQIQDAQGKQLAAATISPAILGAVEWATVAFDAVVLDAGSVSIVLRAAKGEAVWLAAPAATDLHVVRTADGQAPTEAVLAGLAPLYQLLSRSGAAAGAPATTLQLGGATVAPTRDGDKSAYDLKAALAGGATELTFTSTAAGTITVYPPHIEYTV